MPTAQGVGKMIARGIGPMVTPQAAGGVLRRVLEVAIDGYGKLPGAKAAAARQLQRNGGSVDGAVDSIVDFHVRLASAQGFVTNLGGLAMVPVAIPANLAGVAVLQVRMVAAIAHLRGYDLDDNRVRTALIMCLLGGEEVAKHIAEGKLPTSPMAVATAPVFDPDLDQRVAEEVVANLASRIGGKNLALVVTKRVPLVGGGIGAVLDGVSTHQIGKYAKGELVRRRALAG
ncbi:MAG TPA: EcsC family protein [Propionibacteriaceae bacterium]